MTYDDTAQAAPQFGAAFTDSYSSSQSGWYLQGVYQFMPRWRVGYRYDRLDHGTVTNGIVDNGARADGGRLSAADDRLQPDAQHGDARLQPERVQPLPAAARRRQVAPGVTDNQVLLQYIHSLGAHGAHRF